MSQRPDHRGLEALALDHGGYFDRADALAHGLSSALLRHHLMAGRFERIYPGVYRLSVAPSSPHDDMLLAWVWSNYRGVISHESALSLFGLSDLLPTRVHLIVPVDFRRASEPYIIHRLRNPLPEADRTRYEGLPITTAARAIIDAAAEGTDPEQILKAIHQAIGRGLASWSQIDTLARRPNYHGRRLTLLLIERAHEHAPA